jgi:hypothetical protein
MNIVAAIPHLLLHCPPLPPVACLLLLLLLFLLAIEALLLVCPAGPLSCFMPAVGFVVCHYICSCLTFVFATLANHVQVLFSLPELTARYVTPAAAIFSSGPPDPAADLPTQLAKVGVALVTGRTGKGSTAAVENAAGPAPMDITEAADQQAAAAAADPADQPDAADLGGDKSDSASQEANSVRPAAFKSLVGKGSAEFSSGRQQVRRTLLVRAAG